MSDDPGEDRDVIDVATAQGHLDWVRDLIAHRAPEIDAGDIADAYATEAEPDPGTAIWTEVAERMIDTIEALEERLEALERTINGEDE